MGIKTNKYDHVDQLNLYLVIQTLKSCVSKNLDYLTELEEAIEASRNFRKIDDVTIEPLEKWENTCQAKINIAEKMYLLQYAKCRKQARSLEVFESIDLKNPENRIKFFEPIKLEQAKQKVKNYKVG